MKRISFLFAFMLTLSLTMFASNEVVQPPEISTVQQITVEAVQAPATTDPLDVIDQIKNVEDFAGLIGLDGAIMGALMIIFGYLSRIIPFFKKIDNTIYRVATTSIVIILGFIMFGGASIWQGIIAYVFSTSTYELIFKLFQKKEPA